MVASLQMDIRDLKGMTTSLDRVADRFETMQPLMERIGAYGEESTVHRFETGIGPDGQPWVISARAKAESGKTLDDTSRLKGSMTYQARPSSVEWGTNVIYAGRHQFGFEGSEAVSAHTRLMRQAFGKPLKFAVWASVGAYSREVSTVAREFLGLDNDDQAEIGDIVADYMAEALQ